MPSIGTAPARVLTGLANVNSDYESAGPKPAVPARMIDGAHWFFWVVGLVCIDSLFTILGSHLHRFTGFGVTAIFDSLAKESGSSGAVHVIVNGWIAAGFLFLAYCAAEGQKWAFAVGTAAYALDAAMLL
jgi:hypothetical protein